MSQQNDYKELVAFSSRDLAIEESDLSIPITAEEQFQLLRQRIITRVNEMLSADFSGLLNILYRADVNEDRLKQALAENPELPGEVIADAYIQRQLQKIETRRKYSQNKS
ncbi:hypothetical protein [Solitalea lacus]|uniref:hypothetical protein n=1 Tax=Solitalea lacus TaxID=2911172 RepID=UPI001EDBCAF7|nr:hypothetical protein [Solitalea lacus]UKJ06827.1 hypothetical protein L2B55_14970 [Solitalea lacus]